jgi:2-keto-4-pentenoate hydratase
LNQAGPILGSRKPVDAVAREDEAARFRHADDGDETTMAATTETLAGAFIAARRGHKLVDIATLPVPADVDAGFAAQAEVNQGMGYPLAGWKVSLGEGGRPMAGLMQGPYLKSGDTYRGVHGAELRVEIELAIRLGRDMPLRPGQPYTREELIDHCDAALVGIEIVESRIADWTNVPFPLWLADAMGHGGYLLGPEVPFSIFDDVPALTCTVELDGDVLYDRQALHANGDPLVTALAWANRSVEGPLGPLKAGQIITTGSLCGGVLAPTVGPVIARLDPVTAISFALAEHAD